MIGYLIIGLLFILVGVCILDLGKLSYDNILVKIQNRIKELMSFIFHGRI